jgi:hypothetical protein
MGPGQRRIEAKTEAPAAAESVPSGSVSASTTAWARMKRTWRGR